MKKRFGVIVLILLLIEIIVPAIKLPAACAASQLSINSAIQKGLVYLNSTQSSNGEWASDYPVASTAMAVLAFENAPNSHYGWNLSDPYHRTVQNGLNWLFSQARVIGISGNKSAGNPDTNRNGIGIGWYVDSNSNPAGTVYETPMALMAIIASNGQKNVTTTGPPNVISRTYHDIAVDIADWLAWAQNSNATILQKVQDSQYEGGWRYSPQEGDSDNSVSQWPVLGLMAAQSWGIKAPSWVQTELLKWTTKTQNLTGNYNTNPYYGAFDYSLAPNPRHIYTPAETAAGIIELTYCGVKDNDSRIVAAEGYLNRDWNPNGNSPDYGFGWNWNIGDLYDMYTVMKACRLTISTINGTQVNAPLRFIENYNRTNGVEWYNGTGEYVDSLLANQVSTNIQLNGSWNNWVNVNEQDDVSTVLGTAWGTLILEFVPVVVKYTLTVKVVNAYSGDPVSGVAVLAVGQENRSGTTDINGMAIFNKTLAGAYVVFASKPGYASALVSVSLTSNTEATIKLTPLIFTLTVTVVSAATMNPIADAALLATGPATYSGNTGSDGEITLNSVQAGNYTITASKTEYMPSTEGLNITRNMTTTLMLTPLAYTLTVAVASADTNKPIAGATVVATGPATYSGNTGSNGEITLNSVQAGVYQVNASMKGYFSSAPQTVSVTNNTTFAISLQPIPSNVTFEVNFTETSLPYGTKWMVTFDGVAQSSVTSVISFNNISSGIYPYSVGTPVLGGVGVRYVASPIAGSMNVQAQTTQNITFETQYYLTMKTNAGTLSPGSGWFDANSKVTISATSPPTYASECYLWLGWTGKGAGSCTGKSNPTTVIMDGPVSETATWSTIPIFLEALMSVSILASLVFLMIIAAFEKPRRKRERAVVTHR